MGFFMFSDKITSKKSDKGSECKIGGTQSITDLKMLNDFWKQGAAQIVAKSQNKKAHKRNNY